MVASRILRLIACSTVALLSGCGGETPTDAYRAYLGDLAAADYARAFTSLAEGSREAVERLRSAAHAASAPTLIEPDDVRARIRKAESAEEAFRMLITGGTPGFTPPLTPAAAMKTRLSPIENSGDSAVIEAETPLGARRVELRREHGRWKVVLAGL